MTCTSTSGSFYNNLVLVAINKNNSTAANITGLNTALPAGTYKDYLAGLLSGQSLTVTAGTTSNNPAAALTLPANSVSVWQVAGGEPGPSVGSIGPTVGQPGMSCYAGRRQLWQHQGLLDHQRHGGDDLSPGAIRR